MPGMNGFGPIQFKVEGTFMEKPRLLMDGEEVPYASLSCGFYEEISYEFEGKTETIPEEAYLAFSLSGKVGQLEANVSYRVQANEEGRFVVAQVEDIATAKKPWPPKKDEKKDDKDKDSKEKKDEKKPPFKKMKKGKSGEMQPDGNTRSYKQILYRGIIESIVEDE